MGVDAGGLAAAAPLFEGATALMDHAPPGQHPVRAAGGGRVPRRARGAGRPAGAAGVPAVRRGRLATWRATACSRGSRAARAERGHLRRPDGGVAARAVRRAAARLVERIAAVHSADIVLHPSAGGSLDRVTEAYDAARLEFIHEEAKEECKEERRMEMEENVRRAQQRRCLALEESYGVRRDEALDPSRQPSPCEGDGQAGPTGLESPKPLAAREWTGGRPTVAWGLNPDDAVRAAAYRAFGIAREDWEPELRAAEVAWATAACARSRGCATCTRTSPATTRFRAASGRGRRRRRCSRPTCRTCWPTR